MTQSVLITIEGQDKLTGVMHQAVESINKLNQSVTSFPAAAKAGSTAAGGLASSIGNMATVAGGIVAAQVFTRIAEGIGSFISMGFEAVGTAQTLEMSLNALLAANNMYKETTEQVTVAVTKQTMSQEELASKAAELNAKLTTQQATFQEQSEKIRQLTEQYGDNGLVVIKTKAQHEQLSLAMQETQRDIAGLTTSTTEYGTATKTSYAQVMNMEEAQKLAANQSKELLAFVTELAVKSPFEKAQVAQITKFATQVGLGVEQTKEFTSGFLDLAAAAGINSGALAESAYQLTQVAQEGTISAISLKQMSTRGIDLAKIIGVEMGMSVEEFNAQAKKSPEMFDKLFAAIGSYSKKTFGGLSTQMASSLGGLSSTLSDIGSEAALVLFRPLIDTVTPTVSAILDRMIAFVTGGDLANIGEQAAEMLGKGLGKAGAIFRAFGRSSDEGFRMIVYEFEKIWPGIEAQLITWGGMFWGWISSTVIPAGESAIASLTNAIGAWLLNQWDTNVAPKLVEWGNKFWDWVAILYPQIPGYLTGITQGIAAYLTENWPTISAALMAWSAKFWEWVNIAAAAAGTALTALGVAMMEWAQSGEAQASMREVGQNLGTMITDYLTLQFEGGEGSSNALVALGGGLLAAVGGIVGTLIILGGELVAGILDGILTSLGVDLEPATFNELGSILKGIGSNIITIASKVGENIIKGIVKGINDNVSKVFEVIKSMATTAISEAMGALGIQSPSTVFAGIGRDLVAGLVQGTTQAAPDFQGALDRLLDLRTVGTTFMDAFGQARDFIEKSMDKWMGSDKVEFALRAMSKMIKNNLAFAQTATDAQLEDMLMHAVGSWSQAGIMDPERMVGDFVNIFRDTQAQLQEDAAAATAENFNKMMGGVGQFASAAGQEADALAKKISVLDTLLRQGGRSFNVEGHILDAAQAQARLNQLVAEQVAMQPDLTGITGFQSSLQNMQEAQELLGGLAAPVDQAAGDIVGGLNQLTGFLGQQIMTMLGRQMGIPGGTGGVTSGMGAGGMVGGTQNNITFSPTINTVANEQSIIQLFYQMMAMVPGGT